VIQQRPDYVEDQALLDVRVRRAIAFGIDSAVAVEVLSAGKAVPTNTLTSPRVSFYAEIDKVIQKYRFDPRQAQQLMEEAGYAKGASGLFARRDGQPVRFSVASSAGTKNESEVATYVDSLTKAGFEASQRILPAAQIADPEQRAILPGLQVRGGGYQLVTYTSEQIPGPNNRWRGENRGGWNSLAYDRLFEQYSTSLAEADRIAAVAQIERLLTEEVPVIPHFFNAEVNAHPAILAGPISRHTPDTSGTFIGIHTWEWR
jgi:peptide/nickel transport system substrate-binding protein